MQEVAWNANETKLVTEDTIYEEYNRIAGT